MRIFECLIGSIFYCLLTGEGICYLCPSFLWMGFQHHMVNNNITINCNRNIIYIFVSFWHMYSMVNHRQGWIILRFIKISTIFVFLTSLNLTRIVILVLFLNVILSLLKMISCISFYVIAYIF